MIANMNHVYRKKYGDVEETKSLSEETTMLRRDIDESNMFPKSTTDWKTSEQHEEIRELKANGIALKDSPNDTEKSLDHDTLSLDRSESQVKRLSQQIRQLQETANVFFRIPRIFQTRNLPQVELSIVCESQSRL